MIQMTTYNHLSPEERATIMLMLDHRFSMRKIAKRIGRNVSTISRELTRNYSKPETYDANKAGMSYRKRRAYSVKPKKLLSNSSLWKLIEPWLMKEKWSPHQISNRLKILFPDHSAMHVSPEAIYAHIYARPKGELKKMMIQSLRRSKSKRGPRGSKTTNYSSLKIEEDQLIMNRPEDVNTREIAGHWEGDLIVGAMNKSCIGTLVERKTGYLILSKMSSKSAQSVREGFEESMRTLQDFLRISMTYDRGAEMAQHPIMSKTLDMKIYFADPHAPWQRGSNENINGLIRQFLPKGTDLSVHTQSELDYIAHMLNTRPRKRFEYQTPLEMMERELDGGLLRVALDS